MKPAYYNENELFAAEWLRNLIAAGHIAPGDVDTRSITEVKPDDLRSYGQCHFFAGIGGWSVALRLAGIPDDRPVWSGSCPCQPFSVAGAQRGSNDERHLWPAFFNLIRECRPAKVVGEQVAGAAGLAWLDHVCADLEDAGYAAAAADLCAPGAGAFHIRQRLYWVAKSNEEQRRARRAAPGWARGAHVESAGSGAASAVADPECGAAERFGFDMAAAPGSAESQTRQRQWVRDESGAGGNAFDLAHPAPRGLGIHGSASRESGHAALGDSACSLADAADAADARLQGGEPTGQRTDAQREAAERTGTTSGGMGNARGARFQEQQRGWIESSGLASSSWLSPWADPEWIACSDGKDRPAQRGIFPLAHGLPGGRVAVGSAIQQPGISEEQAAHEFWRAGVLRGAGNAIVPHLAAAFVRASE